VQHPLAQEDAVAEELNGFDTEPILAYYYAGSTTTAGFYLR
jgi:hypothetical protein